MTSSAKGIASHRPSSPSRVVISQMPTRIKKKVRAKEICAEVRPSDRAVNSSRGKDVVPCKEEGEGKEPHPTVHQLGGEGALRGKENGNEPRTEVGYRRHHHRSPQHEPDAVVPDAQQVAVVSGAVVVAEHRGHPDGKPMKKATIKNWAYMMTVMAATPSVPIQAMRMRLNTTVMMLEARLVTISEAPLAQLRSSTEKSQRGR